MSKCKKPTRKYRITSVRVTKHEHESFSLCSQTLLFFMFLFCLHFYLIGKITLERPSSLSGFAHVLETLDVLEFNSMFSNVLETNCR